MLAIFSELERTQWNLELSMICILLKCQSQETEKDEMHSKATSQYSYPIHIKQHVTSILPLYKVWKLNCLGTAIIFWVFPCISSTQKRQCYNWTGISEKSTLQRSSDPKTFIRFAVMRTWLNPLCNVTFKNILRFPAKFTLNHLESDCSFVSRASLHWIPQAMVRWSYCKQSNLCWGKHISF